jgi:hypothetical protein
MKTSHVLIGAGIAALLVFWLSCPGCGKGVYTLATPTGALTRSDQVNPSPAGFHYVSANGWLFQSDEGLY